MKFACRVSPKASESLVGFFMRVAEANHLSTVAVFETLRGRVVCPRRIEAALQIAAACRCSVPEVAQLFGLEQRHPDGMRAWRLGNEWITKANFIASRTMAVCPACLSRTPYLPGLWELTFYTACPHHKTRLLTRCPTCHKPLRWTRPTVYRCGCGYDFRHFRCEPAPERDLTVAQLIESRLGAQVSVSAPPGVPPGVVDRLAGLSLDGLFKTIWFLGHRLAEFEQCTAGHGRQKPREEKAERILHEAFELLANWPRSLRDRLAAMESHARTKRTLDLYSRAFKPILKYLEEDFKSQELAFVRSAYEQHIRLMWRPRGAAKVPGHLHRQQEFDFGVD